MVQEKLLHESHNDDSTRMGLGSWRPKWLQTFNSMKWFTAAFSLASLTQCKYTSVSHKERFRVTFRSPPFAYVYHILFSLR